MEKFELPETLSEAEFKIDEHLNGFFVENFLLENPIRPKIDLKNVWLIVRPIIGYLVKFPILPSKWRIALSSFLNALDAFIEN